MIWIWAALALNSITTIVVALVAALLLTKHTRGSHRHDSQRPAPGKPDGLSVIVPIKGADEHTERLLTQLVQSETSRPVEFLFAMESADDPAHAVCQRVAAAHGDRAISIVLSGPPDGLMGKQHNLAVASRQARYPVIASMDADVAVDRTTLATLLAELDRPETGTAFALPYYGGDAPTGGAIVSVYTNYYFIPFMGTWATTGTAPFIIGALWLARHDTVQQAGGFSQFGQTVSDDAIIGQRVRRLGLRNRLAPATVAMPPENLDLAGGVRHLGKWLGMLRAEGIPVLLATLTGWYPTFWAALAAIASTSLGQPYVTGSLWLLGAVAALRLTGAALLNTALYRSPLSRHLMALLVYELLAPVLLVIPAMFRTTIIWKGRRYRIGKGGRILQMEDSQS